MIDYLEEPGLLEPLLTAVMLRPNSRVQLVVSRGSGYCARCISLVNETLAITFVGNTTVLGSYIFENSIHESCCICVDPFQIIDCGQVGQDHTAIFLKILDCHTWIVERHSASYKISLARAEIQSLRLSSLLTVSIRNCFKHAGGTKFVSDVSGLNQVIDLSAKSILQILVEAPSSFG